MRVPNPSGCIFKPTVEERTFYANYGNQGIEGFCLDTVEVFRRVIPMFVSATPGENRADNEAWSEGFCLDTGDIDSPGGHIYMTDNRLVHTDAFGSKITFTYATLADAWLAFHHADTQYSNWYATEIASV